MLPYPERNWDAEFVMLWLLLGLTAFKGYFGFKGNLTERKGTMLMALLLTVISGGAVLFFLLWQTYVLRIDMVLNGILLSLEG